MATILTRPDARAHADDWTRIAPIRRSPKDHSTDDSPPSTSCGSSRKAIAPPSRAR
jgi:hypothetical protein